MGCFLSLFFTKGMHFGKMQLCFVQMYRFDVWLCVKIEICIFNALLLNNIFELVSLQFCDLSTLNIQQEIIKKSLLCHFLLA